MLKYLLSLLSLLLFVWSSYAWTYPVKQVSKPTAKCKFNLWKDLWPACKVNLPKLTPKDYKTKVKDMFYRRIYTVLWASSYKYWWDQLNWTHLWVDIATSKWTPVYSIWDGKVVFVWWKKWRWKVIIIRHRFKWKYIYSNYTHLSKIVVTNWQYVKEWTKIWEVWSTWNSTWNHLHFQIDKNQSIWYHPFWFNRCSAWHSISSITNSTFCLQELLKNTVDPLEFLATNWANINFKLPSVNTIKKVVKYKKISRKWMKSNEQIQEEMIQEFLRTHKFSFKFEKAWVYELWEYGHFTITLKDYRNRPYHDILPADLNIIYDKRYFSALYPRWLKVLDGTRTVSFRTKKTWITFFTIKLWKHFIYQKTIRIFKKWSYLIPKYANIITLWWTKHIGQSYWWLNIFKDKAYMNIIMVPFAWTYTIYGKNVKLCKAPTNIKKLRYFKCNAYNISNSFKFSYKDTIAWILVFKYIWENKWNWYIYIKDKNWKIIAKSRNLYFNDVKLVNNNTNYKQDIQSACKKWLCLGILDRGYIWNNKTLTDKQMKYLFRNFLLYFWKKASIKFSSSDNKTITRNEFVSNLFSLLWLKIKDYYNYKTYYLDIRNLDKKPKNQIKYLSKLWFKWKDRFKLYFQANKKITVEEALSLLNFLIEKYTRK